MLQPPRCIVLRQEHLVCKLKCFLYGLRQSLRAWYAQIDIYLQHKGLRRTSTDPNVYYYRQGKTITILVLYVDELLITSSNPSHISTPKHDLNQEFEMKDLILMKKFLGV